MEIKEGPYLDALSKTTSGVIKQELITYRIKDGMLRQEITTRQFLKDGDYNDVSTVTPLVKTEMTSNA